MVVNRTNPAVAADMNPTSQAWLIAGGVLFIVELFTPGFVAAVFGAACLVTAIPAALESPFWVMVVTFIGATLLFSVTVRPILLKQTREPVRTNADALVGSIGKVLESIDNRASTGRVQAEGDDWRAVSEDEAVISVGEQVEVLRVESKRLYVRRRG